MQIFMLLAIFVFGLIVVGLGIVLAVATRLARASQDPATLGKQPQGYWMGIGIAFGLLIGYVFAFIIGVLTDPKSSIVFGPAMGCIFGVAIGAALEQKHKSQIRSLTEGEQSLRKWATMGGVLLLLVGALALVAMILLTAK